VGAAPRDLARLIHAKIEVDAGIARIIGRPCQIGHAGEWIASRIFDIDLHPSAVTAASDGIFRSGPLAGRSANIKWYGMREGILDIHPGPGPDLYLVMCGPRSTAMSSRGRVRPWVISTVHVFEHERLVAHLRDRRVKISTASSLPNAVWDEAEAYPRPTTPLLTLTADQRELLALFAPPA
jgi:hypothetical protein